MLLSWGCVLTERGFPGGSDGKESACRAGDPSSVPGLGRSSREENGSPLRYSCLENPMDRGGAWQATVHEFAKSWTRPGDFWQKVVHDDNDPGRMLAPLGPWASV